MPRLSRKEKQAKTRSSLMKSAAKVFCRHGMERASIDQVAEEAGYTKGAFYANFKNKEELFLAMLDARFAARIEQIEAVIASEGTSAEKARQAGDDFAEMIAADPEWERLFFEFSAYAARNEDFREELVTRYRSMQDRIARAFEARLEKVGMPPPLPVGQVAMMTCIMGNGFALEKLLEGDTVADDLYGTMLTVFFAGLEAIADARAETDAAAV